jgi:hypothetical protein
MDDIVKQAMRKWPNVPDCYGWLALDARGAWRMRDERAQHLGLPGDKVHQAALLAFINRNYGADERGCWYFQNGPQRVYVNLEATPYIARTDPVLGLTVQTGAVLAPTAAFLTDVGSLIMTADHVIAQVDDRDVVQLLGALSIDGRAAGDEDVMGWMADGVGDLVLKLGAVQLALQRLEADAVPARFGFVRLPGEVGG